MKYYVITEGQIEVMMDKIKTAILKELKPLNLPQIDLAAIKHHPRQIRKRGNRPRLADLIFCTIKKDIFSAAEIFDQIKDKYPFKGDRGIDAIKTAMKADTLRFRRLEDGNYERIKTSSAE